MQRNISFTQALGSTRNLGSVSGHGHKVEGGGGRAENGVDRRALFLQTFCSTALEPPGWLPTGRMTKARLRRCFV